MLLRSRLAGVLAGRLALLGAVGGPLLGVDSSDGGSGLLPVGLLCSVGRLRAEGPHRIGDAVGVPVVLDLGGALAPGPPAPGRLRHGPQRLQYIAGTVGFDGHAGGAPLPGQGSHDLAILRAEVGVGLQPAVADVLVLAQLSFPVMSAVGLLGGHRRPTRDPGGLLAAAQPAKHACGLVIGGLLVGG
jgi:hypothetical protein